MRISKWLRIYLRNILHFLNIPCVYRQILTLQLHKLKLVLLLPWRSSTIFSFLKFCCNVTFLFPFLSLFFKQIMSKLLWELICYICVRTPEFFQFLFGRAADPCRYPLQLNLNDRIPILNTMVLNQLSRSVQPHQCPKLRIFISKIKFVLKMFQTWVNSWNTYVRNSDIWLMSSTNFNIFCSCEVNYMHNSRFVTKLWIRFKNNVGRIIRNLVVKNFKLLVFKAQFVWKSDLAELALELSPVIWKWIFSCFSFSTRLEPVFETLEMDILHGTVTAARRYEGVFRVFVDRFFCETHSTYLQIRIQRILSWLHTHL